MTKTENLGRKKATSGGKKIVRKKPKDKPKRPLSAYNYFFKTERQRILKYLLRNPDDVITEIVVNAEEEQKLWTDGKKISFEEMGKLIGRRWKKIEGEDLEKYATLASGDAERYQKELKVWNEKKEEEKKKAAEEMSMKNAQIMAMHNARNYPSIPNMDFSYDTSAMANSQSYGNAGGIAYAQHNDPNSLSQYGQQVGMSSLQYNAYQTQKSGDPTGLYQNNQHGNTMPQATDGNSYNNLYANYGTASNTNMNGIAFNPNSAQMQNHTIGTQIAQQSSVLPDAGNGVQDYFNQGGLMYGGSYQQNPNNNYPHQKWG